MQEYNKNKSGLRKGHRTSKIDLFDMSLGKIPPQHTDLEESILGAIMLEKDAITKVVDKINKDSFYSDDNKVIYEAIIDLYNASHPIDLQTVANQLQKNGQLEFAGGKYRIAELTSNVNSAANIEYHAHIVSEAAIKRELIMYASMIHHQAYEETVDAFDLLDESGSLLLSISTPSPTSRDAFSLYKEFIQELDNRGDQSITGLPSGISTLDKVTFGFQKSDLIILAARPGMGKTALVCQILNNIADLFKEPVAIFSLEMSMMQLLHRLVAQKSEIHLNTVRHHKPSQAELGRLIHLGFDYLSNIHIDDTPALTILELRARARRLFDQYGIKLIVIDYLQLMSGGAANKGGNREQEISTISRGLKSLAKELNIPVIALSQLSRAVETRGGDKRPLLSDLRESGSIEQDADMVGFLYRAEYYGITEDENGMPTNGIMEVIIAKNRHGSLQNIYTRFVGKNMRVEAYDINTGSQYENGSMLIPLDDESKLDFSPEKETDDLPF